MRNLLLEHLAKGIASPEGCLMDNAFAKQLFLFLEKSYPARVTGIKKADDIETFKKAIMGLGTAGKDVNMEDKRLDIECKSDTRDMRLRKLLLRNVRKFPSPGHFDDDLYYSLDFVSHENEPLSTVIIGSNGSGKSTLFNVLEYAYSGRIPSAELRKIYDPMDYLQHIGVDSGSWEMGADLVSLWRYAKGTGTQNDEGEIPVAGSATFCHQGDVECIEKNDETTEYLYDQLGLGFYHQLVTCLEKWSDEESVRWKDCQNCYWESEKLNNSFDILTLALSGNDEIVGEALKILASSDSMSVSNPLPPDAVVCRTNLRIYRRFIKKCVENDKVIIESFKGNELKYLNRELDRLCDELLPLMKREESRPDLTEARLLWEDIKTRFTEYKELKRKLISDVKEIRESVKKGASIWPLERELVRCDVTGSSIGEKIGELSREGWLSRSINASKGSFREEVWNRWWRDIKATEGYLRECLRQIMKESRETIIEPVVKSLTRIYFEDVGELEPKFEKFKVRFTITLRNSGEEEVAIQKILNTFRMKVFTMSLKCALACCVMKIYNVKLPLIIDDVFDSSDFTNRTDIYRYVQIMVSKYREIMGEQFPFQIIFFTQDELVGEGVERGIRLVLGNRAVKMTRLVESEYVDTLKDELHTVSHTADTYSHRRLTVDIPYNLGIRLRR